MRIQPLIAVATLSEKTGGPARSVPALVAALNRRGVYAQLIAVDLKQSFGPPIAQNLNNATHHSVQGRYINIVRIVWSGQFKRKILQISRETGISIIHDNGLWMQPNHACCQAARELSLPLVISPRGMLTRWALGYRAWKKRIAMSLYQRRDLEGAIGFHATSAEEANGLRELGLSQPIAVIPNGVDAPEASISASDRHMNNKTFLFLSRLNPKKGLENLVEAWTKVRPKGWKVLIAGPSEDGYQEKISALIDQRGVSGDFSFIGPVDESQKWDLYRSADVFVLPTFSENFGMVIAEAMAAGLPVITTYGAPWKVLKDESCGWWVEIGVEPLAEAIRSAAGLSDDERSAMGAIARSIVMSRYSWDSTANQVHQFYSWILGESSRPPFVV